MKSDLVYFAGSCSALLCCASSPPTDYDSDLCTYHHNTRVRVGVECLRAADRLMANLHNLDVPFLVIHSQKDDMTDPDGSKLLVQQAKVTSAIDHVVMSLV